MERSQSVSWENNIDYKLIKRPKFWYSNGLGRKEFYVRDFVTETFFTIVQ